MMVAAMSKQQADSNNVIDFAPPQRRDTADVQPSNFWEICTQPSAVPGKLRYAVDYFQAYAPVQNAGFANVLALTLGGLVAARSYSTTKGQFSSGLFYLVVGQPGSGKDALNTGLFNVLRHVRGKEKMTQEFRLGRTDYTSGNAVFSAIFTTPSQIALWDEFGTGLQGARSRKGSHETEALRTLTSVATSPHQRLNPRVYSNPAIAQGKVQEMDDTRRVFVDKHGFTLLAMTQPDSLLAALSTQDAGTGLLSRFIIVQDMRGIQPADGSLWGTPPHELIDWIQATAGWIHGDIPQEPHAFRDRISTLSFSRKGEMVRLSFRNEIVTLRNAYLQKGETMASNVLARTAEMAMRLSLIVSLSKGEEEISAATMKWCCNFMAHYHKQAVKMLRENLSDSPFESRCKKVKSYLRENAGAYSLRELMRGGPVQGLKKRDFEELLDALLVRGEIELREETTSGRKTQRFCIALPKVETEPKGGICPRCGIAVPAGKERCACGAMSTPK